MTEPSDSRLRELLADVADEAKEIIYDLRGVTAPAGDDGYVWRWAFFYVVLAYDLADSVLVLSDGSHNRALLILRRVMFEYMIRLKFFRKRPDVARAHLDDFTPRARLFERRLAETGFQIIPDPSFQEALHDPQKRYRSFEAVLDEVFPENADDLYAQFYQFPSALIHGDALASIDILEMRDDSSFTVHGMSRRYKTNEILYNYVAFFITLLEEACAVLNVHTDRVERLRQRREEVRQTLGLDILT